MRISTHAHSCSILVALALVLAPVAATAAPPDAFEPVEIVPPPERAQPEPPPPEPVVEPEPEPEPVEPPPPVVDPELLSKIKTQRTAGIGVMAAGGAVAVAGLGMVLAFTILGDELQDLDDPVQADIEKKDSLARVGGLVLASGIAIVAIGGVVFANANKKDEKRKYESMAKIRVVPTAGGLVLRF